MTAGTFPQRKKNLDFSFAGLKTAVRLAVDAAPEDVRSTQRFKADVAASFQHAAFSHVEQRLRYAMDHCAAAPADARGARPSALVVSGGVAANRELRRRLQRLCDATPAPHSAARAGGQQVGPASGPAGGDASAAAEPPSWRLVVPPPRLCTDNGVMVGWAAVEAIRAGTSHAPEEQGVRARWPLGRAAVPSLAGGSPSKKPELRKGVELP